MYMISYGRYSVVNKLGTYRPHSVFRHTCSYIGVLAYITQYIIYYIQVLQVYTSQIQLPSVMFLARLIPLPTVDHAGNNKARLLYIIIIRLSVVYGVSILALIFLPALAIKYNITVRALHPTARRRDLKSSLLLLRSSPDPWRQKSSAKSQPTPERILKLGRFSGNGGGRRTRARILTAAIVTWRVVVYWRFIFTHLRFIHHQWHKIANSFLR